MNYIKTKAFMAIGISSILIILSVVVANIIGESSILLAIFYLIVVYIFYYLPTNFLSKRSKGSKHNYSSKLWVPGIVINNCLAIYYVYAIIDVALYGNDDPAAAVGIIMLILYWVIQFSFLSFVALAMKSSNKLL